MADVASVDVSSPLPSDIPLPGFTSPHRWVIYKNGTGTTWNYDHLGHYSCLGFH